MLSLKKFLLTTITLWLVLISPALALSPSSVLVDVFPTNPAPNENVDITLRSFAANLDSVTITWLVNGKTALSGIGKKSFSVNAGASGTLTTILVKVLLPDGEIDKTVILRPSSMVMLWQANDSYLPPFYRGKAMPVSDSEVKIVAMPEIKTGGGMLNPKNMTYFWKRNQSNEQESSGYGKNYFTYIDNYLENSSSVSVEALSVDQKYGAEGEISVSTVEPQILFYKKDPDVGILWESALQDHYRIQGGEVVVATPYFISPKDIRKPDLVWSWFINDTQVQTNIARKNTLPLEVDAGASGTSRLRLNIDNTWKIFQSTSKEITVQF